MEILEQENKYYKPESHEFRVGLECEILEGRDYNDPEEEELWKPYVWSEYDYAHSVGRSCSGVMREIRIKYLDREDIESLGFKVVKDYSDTYIFQSTIEVTQYGECWYEIDYDKQTHNITIEKWIDADRADRSSREQLFKGLIKNQSELSIILKQVGMS